MGGNVNFSASMTREWVENHIEYGMKLNLSRADLNTVYRAVRASEHFIELNHRDIPDKDWNVGAISDEMDDIVLSHCEDLPHWQTI